MALSELARIRRLPYYQTQQSIRNCGRTQFSVTSAHARMRNLYSTSGVSYVKPWFSTVGNCTLPRLERCRITTAVKYSTLPDSVPRQPSWWSTWIPKLILNFGENQISVGSGFFVNIVDAKKDVILTAGHNLIMKDGTKVKDVEVIVDGKQVAVVTKWSGQDRQFFLNESYENQPNETNSINDYGAIIIEKGNSPRHGFGFSLPLAYTDLVAEGLDAFVGGYPGPDNTQKDSVVFKYALGPFGKNTSEQLFYHASTVQGQSGGPVWVLYKGYETVVGIHNHDSQGGGNRATRLNMEVLKRVYEWAHVGKRDVGIITTASAKKNPENRVHLKFTPVPGAANQEYYAVARLGKDGASTSFDILPTHTLPSDATLKSTTRYSIINKQLSRDDPSKWLALTFDGDPNARPKQITATPGVFPGECLAKLTEKGRNVQIEPSSVSGKQRESRIQYVVRLEAKYLPEEIDPDDDVEPESREVEIVNASSPQNDISAKFVFASE